MARQYGQRYAGMACIALGESARAFLLSAAPFPSRNCEAHQWAPLKYRAEARQALAPVVRELQAKGLSLCGIAAQGADADRRQVAPAATSQCARKWLGTRPRRGLVISSSR
jgi:hypothetical protein